MKIQTAEFCNDCRHFNFTSAFCMRVKIYPKEILIGEIYFFKIHRRCPLPDLDNYKSLDKLKKRMRTEIDK